MCRCNTAEPWAATESEAREIRVDVRSLPPRERHPTLMGTWESLADGETMILLNDHDPLPLYYQFACEHRGTFHWQYAHAGPDTWEVRVTKGRFPDPGFHPQTRMAKTESTTPTRGGQVVLDVRPIFERGETPCDAIDAAAARVGPGEELVLLAPFEPVPLYTKLGRQGFRASPERQQDGSWRILFTR